MLVVDAYLDRSPIHGLGVFARNSIPAQTLVWEFTPNFDLEIPVAVVTSLPPRAQQYLRHYGSRTELDSYMLCGDHARFMNHSDQPNISAATDKGYALREIAAGEEITCDYREFDLDFGATRLGE